MNSRLAKFSYFLLLLLPFAFSNCRKDNSTTPIIPPAPTINLKFIAVANNAPLVFNTTITNVNAQRYLINYLAFYVGNIRLIGTDNVEHSIKDIVLVNFDDSIAKDDPTRDPSVVGTSFSLTGIAGNFKAIKMGIGVPAALEPAQSGKTDVDYPIGHPLGFNRGMYWDPWSIYRFAIITGRVDTNKVKPSTPTWPFSYHTGFDSLYREVSFSDNFSISNGQSHTITIQLDVNKIFYNASYTTDLFSENQTHMSQGNIKEGLLGVKITNSLVIALSKL